MCRLFLRRQLQGLFVAVRRECGNYQNLKLLSYDKKDVFPAFSSLAFMHLLICATTG